MLISKPYSYCISSFERQKGVIVIQRFFHCEPEGRYRCTKFLAIAPFWFSTEYLWIAITPFWFSAGDISFIKFSFPHLRAKASFLLYSNSPETLCSHAKCWRHCLTLWRLDFKKWLNFDVCFVWRCSDASINSQEYKSFDISAITRSGYLWLNITIE